MPVITVDLEQEQIDRAQRIADHLSEVYGVKVSRASVIRRAIMAYAPYDLQEADTADARPEPNGASQ